MTGLRLTREGVGEAEFRTRFDQSMRETYRKELESLLRLGLIENGMGERIRLTKQGRLLGNQVFMRFV